MKTKILLLFVTSAMLSAQAATNYWDINGATSGAGGPAATGTWDGVTANWTSDPLGEIVPLTWTAGDDAIFSAGSDATGTFTVTVSGTQTAGNITLEEGTVTISGGTGLNVGGGVASKGVFDVAASRTLTVGSVVPAAAGDNTGRLTKNGAGILSFTGNNLFTGGVTINGGTFSHNGESASAAGSASTSGAIPATTNASYILINGVSSVLRGIRAGIGVTYLAPAKGITLNGGGTLEVTDATAGNLNIYAGVIAGTGPLVKTGPGVLALPAVSTYSGATIISNGTLRIRTSSNRIPTTTDVFVYGSGRFDPGSTSGNVQQVNSINGDGSVVYSASSTLIIAGNTNSTLTGVISDGTVFGRIAKQGTGTLTLSGANTFDGSITNISGATVVTPGGSLCGPDLDLVINGGTVDLNNVAQTILSVSGSGGTLTLASGHTLTINPAGTRTYSGVVAGPGAITKTGVGTTVLAGPNTYSGATAVNAGRLIATTASANAGSYTVADLATLGVRLASNDSSLAMSDLTLGNSTAEFDFAGEGYPTTNVVTDGGALTVNGTVAVDLKGFDTTGTATLVTNVGTRSGAGSFVTGVLPPRVQGFVSDDTSNNRVLFTATNADSIIWVGDATGNWDTNNGANLVWKLASDNSATYYQETKVQGDTVRFDDTASGLTTVTLTTNLTPFRATVDNSTTNYIFSGVGKLTGVTLLTKSGTGDLTIATANDHSGGSTLNAGSVSVGNNSAFGTGKLTINAGTIRSDGATARTMSMPVDLSGNVSLGDAVNVGDLTFSGAWTIFGGSRTTTVDTINVSITGAIGQDIGGRGLTKVGSGTLSLTVANTFSGGFNHNAGTVRVNNNASLGAANSPVTYANGVTLSTTAGTGRTLTYAHTLNGNLTLGQVSGGTAAVTLAGSVDLAGATRTITTVNASDTISAVITNGGLIKEGSGTLVLGNAGNLYAGTTTINAGRLSIDADATLGNGSGALIFNGGDLNVTADRDNNIVANPLTLSANAEITTTSTAAAADCRFSSGTISASPGVKLTLRNDGADGANDTFEVRFSGGGINYGEEIIIDNGSTGKTRLNFFNTNTDPAQVFSGVISGNGSINRSASVSGTGGTTIFTAENTYSGGTTINGGTLLVNNTTGSGTGSGAVTVNSTGTLGGTGTVGGAVVVNSGGKIAPGTSAGTLTLQGGLNLSSGGTYAWELGAHSVNPGSFDNLAIAGSDLVLGGTSKISVNFSGTASSPELGDAFWASPRSWTVATLAGGTNPGDTDFQSVVNGIYTNGYFTTSVSAGNVILNFTPSAPPQPQVTSVQGAGTTNVTINFTTAIKGATYQVQYKDDLNNPTWSVLGSVVANSSTASISDTTSPAPTQRFYRLCVQ